ncbi:cupin-like domain-containing protein [Streptomyces sp. NPDC013172]|uniref:cupin-like domain-containing protein n=1 Tax=Streptomyces sp. NPDC013172 TaxID=3155009 RepID=UPI0033FCC3F9
MPGLSYIVQPVDVFLAAHWPDNAFYSAPRDERLQYFEGVQEFQSANSVIDVLRATYAVRKGGEGIVCSDDRELIKKLYQDGNTCSGALSSGIIPRLDELLEGIARDIGLTKSCMGTEVFLSQGESGVPMHSDWDINFSLLLRGKKTWKLAPNRHVVNQTRQIVPAPGMDAGTVVGGIASAGELPFEMPADCIEFHVSPGGVVFTPRGWWHQTTSEEE